MRCRIRQLRLFAAAAALATAAALAAPASATSISLSNVGIPGSPYPTGQHLIVDFNEGASAPPLYTLNNYPTLDANYTMSLGNATVGYQEGMPGYSGTLPNDATNYLTVIPNTTATLTRNSGYMTSFSFYMGSPDPYNYVTLHGLGGYTEVINGDTITASSPGGSTQEWSWGKRINLDFQGAKITSIDFTSGQIAFEVDNFAAASVPEPATWGLMIAGFGGIGAVLRRRRQTLVAA